MTNRERFRAIARGELRGEVFLPFNLNYAWFMDETLARWHSEGLPPDADLAAVFGFQPVSMVGGAPYSLLPPFPEETLAEDGETRTFRDGLNGGMFGAGRIFLDGFEIPIMPYEWALTGHNNLSDAYLLTNKVGGQRLINGQYNDMSKAVPKMIAADYTDGGRLLTWTEQDKTCLMREVEMQPRLLAWAPWAQARFIDILCSTPGGPLSPDPWDLSFFPECSFHTDVCSELHD